MRSLYHRQVDRLVGIECHASQLVDHERLALQPDSHLSVNGRATVFESDGNPRHQKDRCGDQQADYRSQQVNCSFCCAVATPGCRAGST